MYVCIYIYIYIYIYMYICIHICMYKHICMFTRICMCLRVHVCAIPLWLTIANTTAHNCIVCPRNKFDCKALSQEAYTKKLFWLDCRKIRTRSTWGEKASTAPDKSSHMKAYSFRALYVAILRIAIRGGGKSVTDFEKPLF